MTSKSQSIKEVIKLDLTKFRTLAVKSPVERAFKDHK
jgi:hypothetical protein